MDLKTYKDKVRACWLGKNIGGTLGAPFECKRMCVDLDYYTHDLAEGVLPNDDLDLQLVWLNVAERHGVKVNSKILGDFWLVGVIANWSEYGGGRANLRNGILPPASGTYRNTFGQSNGAFIRSEIWACLAPGNPSLAVKYAFEDASVDHKENGVYAELFCAAIESAAFFESDRDTLINIGLSYIPSDCAVAKAVAAVRQYYADGLTWKEARKKLLCDFPSTFGARFRQDMNDGIPVGELGFDAPSNIGIMVLGWIYGENDFSKSICIAAGCGEDSDCTAGTLASILGIINGTKGIDEKWLKPIGDQIKTVSINVTEHFCFEFPKTVTELTDRVTRTMTTFMRENIKIDDDGNVSICPEENLFAYEPNTGWIEHGNVFAYMFDKDLVAMEESCFADTFVSTDGLEISENEEKTIRIKFRNKTGHQMISKIEIMAPDDWEYSNGRKFTCYMQQFSSGTMYTDTEFSFIPHNMNEFDYTMTLAISFESYTFKQYIPIRLFKRNGKLKVND